MNLAQNKAEDMMIMVTDQILRGVLKVNVASEGEWTSTKARADELVKSYHRLATWSPADLEIKRSNFKVNILEARTLMAVPTTNRAR